MVKLCLNSLPGVADGLGWELAVGVSIHSKVLAFTALYVGGTLENIFIGNSCGWRILNFLIVSEG